MKYIIILTLFITGCGTFQAKAPIEEVNAEFQEYYDLFEEIYGVSVDVPIDFEEIDDNYLGVCRYNGRVSYIYINPNHWNTLEHYTKVFLVFHELGHCFFKQDHRDYYLPDSCPGSIMSTYASTETCYETHYEYYILELVK